MAGLIPRAHVILYLHSTDVLAGGERSLLNLIRHLDPARFRAHVACDATEEYIASLQACGVPVERLGFPGFRVPGPAVWRAVCSLARLCRSENASILHANTPRTNLYAAMAGRLARVNVVWHCRNLLEPGMRDTDRWFARFPDRIICNSRAIAARFRSSHWTRKIAVIHNGVDLTEFDPISVLGSGIRRELGWEGHPIIVATSRLDPEKGHATLLEAMPAILQGVPETRLLIAGRAAAEPERRHAALATRIEDLGLGHAVHLLGYRRDIPEILAASDICVLPADAEACGRVLFEAMAMARPIVATASGGTPEIVEDGVTGFLVPPRDPLRLARALLLLLEDADRRHTMGEAGRSRVEQHFTIEAHCLKTMALYKDLLDCSGPGSRIDTFSRPFTDLSS